MSLGLCDWGLSSDFFTATASSHQKPLTFSQGSTYFTLLVARRPAAVGFRM